MPSDRSVHDEEKRPTRRSSQPSWESDGRPAVVETIPEMMRNAARGPGTRITYTDSRLNARQHRLGSLVAAGTATASALSARGIGLGDTLCFLSRTEHGLLTALLGAWHVGAIPTVLPLPRKPDDPGFVEELRRRLHVSKAKGVVVSDEIAETLPHDALPVPLITFHDLDTEALRGFDGSPVPSPEDVALLQFTSGTTSMAKAVPISHRQLVRNMAAVGKVLAPRSSDRLITWLPLYHDMGIISLVGTMMHGAEVVIMSPDEFLRRPGAWLEALHAFGGTGTVAPNFAYGLAARDLKRRKPEHLDLSGVRCAMNGAEPIDLDVLDTFASAARPYGFRRDSLCPMYGLAEATLAVTITSPDESLGEAWVERTSLVPGARPVLSAARTPGSRRLAACGSAVEDTELRVVDEDGEPLSPGHMGQIAVRGPGVMAGYWFDDEAQMQGLAEGNWLLTGDLGFERAGQWFVCGRVKDMMILRGQNFYPEDYESVADSVPRVRFGHSMAFALLGAERMVLVAELRAPAEQADDVARELMEAVRAKLNHPPHRVIIVRPKELPRTSSGKRRRAACRDLYLDEALNILGQFG